MKSNAVCKLVFESDVSELELDVISFIAFAP